MNAVARSRFVTAKVLEKNVWTERLFTLKLGVSLPDFLPGQFVRLRLPVNGEPVARSYSLVNAPGDAALEILFNTVSRGTLSLALARLEVGDEVEVSTPASGFFTLSEVPAAQHLWLFATGTGVGPYVSMLRQTTELERFDKVLLVHSVQCSEERTYHDWLHQRAASSNGHFQYFSCVTRSGGGGDFGRRFTDLLSGGELELAANLDISVHHSHVMLCGSHKMLEDMKILLATRGMEKHLRHKPGHITTEQYF